MGKPTGFMEIKRQTSMELPPEERIQNFNEFHVPLHTDEQQAQGCLLYTSWNTAPVRMPRARPVTVSAS